MIADPCLSGLETTVCSAGLLESRAERINKTCRFENCRLSVQKLCEEGKHVMIVDLDKSQPSEYLFVEFSIGCALVVLLLIDWSTR